MRKCDTNEVCSIFARISGETVLLLKGYRGHTKLELLFRYHTTTVAIKRLTMYEKFKIQENWLV